MPETLSPPRVGTLVDALAAAIRAAAAYDPNTQAAPACVLWTDEKEEWTPLLPRLRSAWPHLFTLGAYAPGEPEARTGPSIWIKAALGRGLPGADWPEGEIPVVYLPGVGRSRLRAAASLSREHQPIAELQYRGVVFSQVNGRDWTPLAFLASEDGGLGLDVARDAATLEALRRALPELATLPVERLASSRVEATDLNALLAPDPARDVLRWLDDPEVFREAQGPERWAAFRAVCRERFGLDPEKAGPLAAAEKLGHKKGPWAEAWARFQEAAHRYPRLPERLSQAKPATATADLFGGAVHEGWPQDNTHEEEMLRAALLALENATPAQAAERIQHLEERHGMRSRWVWAELGKAPLAQALRSLVALTEAAAQPVAGPTAEACADTYREQGWRADDAFLRALDATSDPDDARAVRAAAVALYRPWLEGTAAAFEAALGGALPPQPEPEGAKPKLGQVWLFVDGLRYDVGQRLADVLEAVGVDVSRAAQWAAFPSLTPTAKPGCSPIADAVKRPSAMHDFAPETEGGELTTHRFRSILKERGFQVLATEETGDPSGSAWAEIGVIDTTGHQQGWKLACRLDDLVRDVAARVRALLAAGWREVRVVTDHGWLLLPGGLPKTDLPKALTNVKWGRCAELKGASQTDLPTHGWYWNRDVQVAVARGVHTFVAGTEYAHGGLTLQECFVPTLTVTGGASTGGNARITSVEWLGLRCRVEVEGGEEDVVVDLRRHAADASSSVTAMPKAPEDGRASLIVPDDTLEGRDAVTVLLDSQGRLVHQVATIVGG